MGEQRDESGQSQAGKPVQSRKPAHSSGATEPFAATDRVSGDDRTGSGTRDRTSATVVRRKQRYLIGFRSLPGIMPLSGPLSGDPFLERVSQMEGVEIIRRLPALSSPQARTLTAASATPTTTMSSETMVVRMDEQRGEALRQNAPPYVIVELDAPLDYSDMVVPEPLSGRLGVQAMPFPRPRRELLFQVIGEGDRPLANAVINLYGAGLYGPGILAQAVTDSSGQASLQTHAVEGADMQAIYVRPAADHWERYIRSPSLEPGQVNVIRFEPAGSDFTQLSGERPYGWGQRIMKFDRVSTDWSGTGTKIGLIDSGCDTSHPLLHHVARASISRETRTRKVGEPTSWDKAPTARASSPAPPLHRPTSSAARRLPKCIYSKWCRAVTSAISSMRWANASSGRLDIVQIGISGQQFSELAAQKITEARFERDRLHRRGGQLGRSGAISR